MYPHVEMVTAPRYAQEADITYMTAQSRLGATTERGWLKRDEKYAPSLIIYRRTEKFLQRYGDVTP